MIESLEREIRDLRSLFWSERDPDGRGFASLADAYRRAGDFRQALELLGEGLERLPGFATGHAVSARVHLDAGMVEEATFAARKTLELDSENVWALRTLADALVIQGDDVGAAEARASLRALDPVAADAVSEGPEATGARADLASPEPEMAGPVVDIEDLAPDEPEEAGPVVDIEDLAPDEPEMTGPVVDIEDLAPDEPEEDPAWDVEGGVALEPIYTRTMAELYVHQGLKERALKVYRRLVEADPADERLRTRLAEVEASPNEGGGRADEEETDVHARYLAAAGERGASVETPFAWTDEDPAESMEEGPPISSYFERMLAWTPREEKP